MGCSALVFGYISYSLGRGYFFMGSACHASPAWGCRRCGSSLHEQHGSKVLMVANSCFAELMVNAPVNNFSFVVKKKKVVKLKLSKKL